MVETGNRRAVMMMTDAVTLVETFIGVIDGCDEAGPLLTVP